MNKTETLVFQSEIEVQSEGGDEGADTNLSSIINTKNS